MKGEMSVLTVLLLLQSLTTLCVSVKLEHTAKYFSNVTLICDEMTVRQGAYPAFLKYWILPNQNTLQWSQQPDSKHSLSPRPGYSLTINHVEDSDLGTYHCVILWDNRIFLVDSIKIGLSVDNGNIREQYRQRAVIGGIAVSATVCFFLLVCLLCYLRHSATGDDNKREDERFLTQNEADEVRRRDEERRAVFELDRTVQRFDETLAGDDEIALRSSRIPAISADRITDADYATVSSAGKVTAISDGSSGFFDNKVFEIENEAIFPFDESNSEMNFSRDFADQFL